MTAHELDAIEKQARHKLPTSPGDVQALVDEVRRLRAWIDSGASAVVKVYNRPEAFDTYD